jgi:hypothetical protein
LERAIEEFSQKKKQRSGQLQALREKAAQGGVKGKAAENEIKQMETQDLTEMNRLEVTLNAAKKRAAKSSEAVLEAKKKKEEEEKQRQREESRAKLAAKAALFNTAQK